MSISRSTKLLIIKMPCNDYSDELHSNLLSSFSITSENYKENYLEIRKALKVFFFFPL